MWSSSGCFTCFLLLTGGLEDATMMFWVILESADAAQEVDFPWSSGSGRAALEMPPLLELSDDYEPVSLETISGTTIDYLNDDGSDLELLSYHLYEYEKDSEGKTVRVRNSWTVSNLDSSRPLIFSEIPAGSFSFEPASSPYNSLLLAGASAAYGYYDEDPEVKWSGPDIMVADTGTAVAAAKSAQRRMSPTERSRILRETAPRRR